MDIIQLNDKEPLKMYHMPMAHAGKSLKLWTDKCTVVYFDFVALLKTYILLFTEYSVLLPVKLATWADIMQCIKLCKHVSYIWCLHNNVRKLIFSRDYLAW